MRLSLLFSLAIGLVALLAVSERMPRWLGSDGALETQSRSGVARQAAHSKSLPIEIEPRDQGTPAKKEHGRIYKWRDARGGIHIATEPPPADIQAVIIPFVREHVARPTDHVTSAAQVNNKAVPAGSPSALLSVYTPEGFEDLLERVEETALKLRERNGQLKALEDQLQEHR